MPKKEKKKVSNYTLLNRWLYDGSDSTSIPEEVVKDKSISQLYLLYYFQCSHYNLFINKVFNNYNLFTLDRLDIFKFLKKCIQMSGYRPPFIKRAPKRKNKLSNVLSMKYPFLKKEEIFMLIDVIDNSDDKKTIYEMFGFYNPKKKKTTKIEKKRIEKNKTEQNDDKEELSLNNLMGNFSE